MEMKRRQDGDEGDGFQVFFFLHANRTNKTENEMCSSAYDHEQQWLGISEWQMESLPTLPRSENNSNETNLIINYLPPNYRESELSVL
jgi:hypothetical protein